MLHINNRTILKITLLEFIFQLGNLFSKHAAALTFGARFHILFCLFNKSTSARSPKNIKALFIYISCRAKKPPAARVSALSFAPSRPARGSRDFVSTRKHTS
jgi:hypothetical protein